MKVVRFFRNHYTRLVLNFLCAAGYSAIGLSTHSWWFITVGAYDAVLTAARFSVLQIRRTSVGDPDTERFAGKITGIMLIALSFCIVGMNILSALKDRGTVHHEIVMITIATYTFTKITIAVIGMVKAKRTASMADLTLRNISLADACVSVCSMQRSMLVSFPGMTADDIQLLNILTGTAVWITVLLLGLNLIGGKYTTMAKSKLTKAAEQLSEAVSDGYRAIESGVVNGYKKIEQGMVEGYTKVEDRFVERYLTKDGETVEEATERLKNGNK